MATATSEIAGQSTLGLRFASLSNNIDSAYNSDESPTLVSPLRCTSCRTIPPQILRRRLPCGHFFCEPCSTSTTPENSLTLYCPICGDQSIAPFQSSPSSELGSNMQSNAPETRQSAKEAWTRLQTFSEACRRRIDDVDCQRRFHSPTRASDTLSNISELEELEESLDAVVKLLRRQETSDRTNRILGDLRDYGAKLQTVLTRLNSPIASPEEGETWRRSFADAKAILRTLCTRAKLESQRLEGDPKNPLRRALATIGNGISTERGSIPNGTDSTQPWTISIGGEGAVRCRRNAKNIFTVTAKNGSGEPVTLDRSHLAAYLLSVSTGRRVSVVAIRQTTTPGFYELTYYVNREGAYHLVVKFSGQHIGGSPFPIRCAGDDSGHCYYNSASGCSVHSSGPLSGARTTSGSSGGRGSSGDFAKRTTTTTFSSSRSRTQSKSPRRRVPVEDDMIMECGSHGRGFGQFSNPQGVCCTQDGRLIAADSNNQCVQIFDLQTGQCQARFGKRGRTAGDLQRPTGVAVLPNSGNILVADYDNRWISVHDRDGGYLGRFGNGKLLGPRGLAVDADDHVIIVDNKGSSILVYDLHKLKFVRQFGSRGDRLEQLAGPHYCAVSQSANLLYLTDFHHHCVKVFDCRGQYQFAFGSLGEGNGQFQAPTGIAVDSNQHVLVADWGNSRIQVFDHSGSFLSFVNSNAHPLFGPQGLAMTPDGNVVVADTGNHCCKIYRYL